MNIYVKEPSKLPLEPKAEEFAAKLLARRLHDTHWAFWNYVFAQIVLWTAVVSSLGLTIAAAFEALPRGVIAVVAAIPGASIIVDYSFAFGRRSRWHHLMRTRLEILENSLRYEGASVDSISQRLAELYIEMETRYPGLSSNSAEFKPEQLDRKSPS